MTTSKKAPALLRRMLLPVLCAGLAAASARWGELVLVEYAGRPVLGPLVAAQVVAMISVAFATLSIITFLLAVFPGRQAATASDTPEADLDDDDTPASATDRKPTAARNPDDIIEALKRSASKQALGRIEAEKRADDAEAKAASLETELAAFRDGTAPEYQALEGRLREDANRDALRRIEDLDRAHVRAVTRLQEAKGRVEGDLAARTAELAETQQALKEAQAALPQARVDAAADEYRRIQIALAAINDTQIEVLDPMQRDAVKRHAHRITEAMRRLDPNAEPDHGPSVAMPPLADLVASLDPDGPPTDPDQPHTPDSPADRADQGDRGDQGHPDHEATDAAPRSRFRRRRTR